MGGTQAEKKLSWRLQTDGKSENTSHISVSPVQIACKVSSNLSYLSLAHFESSFTK